MTVKELMDELSKMDPNMTVLGEYDQDGDDFMVKYGIANVYVGNGIDDSNWDDDDESLSENNFCIIKL